MLKRMRYVPHNMGKLTLTLAAIMMINQSVHAAGFFLPLSNIADFGNANAGGAALAADASTAFTNPAGLVLIPNQLVIAGGGIDGKIHFVGQSSAPNAVGGGVYTESGSTNTSLKGVSPAIYYSQPLSPKFAFGFLINAPAGLTDLYPTDSVLRYHVIRAKLLSLGIGPNLAYKISDHLAFGFGIDSVRTYLNLKANARTQAITSDDSTSLIDTLGWGFGWHVGLLMDLSRATRLGISYHSQVVEKLKGKSQFYSAINGTNYKDQVNQTKANFTLPPFTTLSIYHHLNNKWSIMGSLEYQQWSYFKNLHTYNVASLLGTQFDSYNFPTNYHNTFKLSLGLNYQLNDQWLLRVGSYFDEGATKVPSRGMLNPDSNSLVTTIGAHYAYSKNFSLDAAYGYIQSIKANINHTNEASGVNINGTRTLNINVLGIQANWNFT